MWKSKHPKTEKNNYANKMATKCVRPASEEFLWNINLKDFL